MAVCKVGAVKCDNPVFFLFFFFFMFFESWWPMPVNDLFFFLAMMASLVLRGHVKEMEGKALKGLPTSEKLYSFDTIQKT